MGIIEDKKHGPHFTQPDAPNDVKLSKLWWNSNLKQLQGANGTHWIGVTPPPVGTEGYAGGSGTMNKLTFSTETVIAHANTFVRGDRGVSSLVGGYSFGSGGNNSSVVGKLLFSTGVISNLAATLTQTIQVHAACHSGAAGYKMSGDTNTFAGIPTDLVDKLTFSSEAIAAIAATTTPTSNNFNFGIESVTKGYNCGGGWSVSTYSSIQSLTFSIDSISNVVSNLTAGNRWSVGINGEGNGYLCGGQNSTTLINKMVFSSESVTALASVLNPGRFGGAPISAKPKGYVCGGDGSSTKIERMTFATDAFAAISAVLAVAGTPYTPFGCENLN